LGAFSGQSEPCGRCRELSEAEDTSAGYSSRSLSVNQEEEELGKHRGFLFNSKGREQKTEPGEREEGGGNLPQRQEARADSGV
jgi:hypothetical protein